MASRYSRRTKIICTLGPATNSATVIERLIKAGMNFARLNLSHGTHSEHAAIIRKVRGLSHKLSLPVSILMDLPGPKYRTGRIKNDSAELKKGKRIVLTTEQIDGDESRVSVNLPGLPRIAKKGDTVLLDDGNMELRVIDTTSTDVVCRILVGGVLTEGRGVVIPGMPSCEPFVSDNLCQHISFAIKEKPDYIALSFVCMPEEVQEVRTILARQDCNIPIISKIERGEAVKNIDRIIDVSDAIMVARGDLGVDIPIRKVPLVQKEIIHKCNLAGKAVITATQMLESMVNAARPTRAEVTDIANAIFDGTDAIMLSAETSIGKYPVSALRMMAQIAEEAEHRIPHESWLAERCDWVESTTDELISYNACYTAQILGASAIVAYTQTGSTARRVSKYRPRMPILAITPSDWVPGQIELYRGVYAVHLATSSSIEELFLSGARTAKECKLAKQGELVVITGGIPLGVTGSTNLLKVERVT